MRLIRSLLFAVMQTKPARCFPDKRTGIIGDLMTLPMPVVPMMKSLPSFVECGTKFGLYSKRMQQGCSKVLPEYNPNKIGSDRVTKKPEIHRSYFSPVESSCQESIFKLTCLNSRKSYDCSMTKREQGQKQNGANLKSK